MGRRQNDPEATHCSPLVLLLVGLASCALVYAALCVVLKPNEASSFSELESLELVEEGGGVGVEGESGGCCRGTENLELWGAAVKWGSEFKLDSSEQCCKACKAMCTGTDGPCLCDSWVFCGNKEACGSKFGECWLKKQKDTLAPERQEVGETVSWTSGLIFGRGEGIVGLETKYGTLHIKLLPDCAPHSVAYILELLALRHCAGCQFYRAERRGSSWDSEGNHIKNAPFGPPFALVQGTLDAQGVIFKKIPTEVCPTIRRGSVAWIGSGPEFFISLANHEEWKKEYTVFASVLPEDMNIAEKIAQLPTTADVWNSINVSVLEKPVPLFLRRMKTSHGDLTANMKSN
ncbi:PREDICTED: uncharacterized protein LOC103342610 [Prunus mume]|uniref:Uncharacterized protein LOC103342610 n=1 Tax=Prunus mume TaxID=102107 RepID=A0ABM0PU15_PRUMU|nr:PREDICTED: uncharacterized protein LOC103342610 [Prunus mume]